MKTILDIELSEEEEDDDYNPEKEKEVSPLPTGRSVASGITGSEYLTNQSRNVDTIL